MKLSVVIPCFNAADTIAVQLEALFQQKWNQPWEVIVADNGSTDETLAIAKQYTQKLPNLCVVDASSLPGAAHARNVGAKVARGEALVFCDADDEVAPGWLAAMGEALSKYDFVGGRREHWKFNEPWILKTYGCEADNGVFFDHPYLPLAAGNNLGVKKWLHDAIGGFDETILILDDVDYSWRIQQAGYKLHEASNALVHFRFRHTLVGIVRRAWDMGCQEPLLYKKHRPIGMPQLISWKTIIKTGIMFPFRFLLLQIRDKASLAQCIMDLAWRAGQLQGCIKYRYLPV
ncbi:glycosyltransferase family A protein [Scytonema sp. NUACC21]